MNATFACCLIAGAIASVPLAAHPGHDEVKLLIGTVVEAENGAVHVETFDQAAMQPKRLAIVVDQNTKWLVGKRTVAAQDLTVGERVELLVKVDDLPDGSTRTRAVQVKRKEPKRSVRQEVGA